MIFDLDIDGFNRLAGIKCIPDGPGVRFMAAGQAATVLLVPDQELISLYPDRSASHRALEAALNATQTGQAAQARAASPLSDRQTARAAFAQTEAAGQ